MKSVQWKEHYFGHRQLSEYYNAIRTNIQFSGHLIKTVMITSYKENEGKSTVAQNLAYSFSRIGKKTLLIDADTRNSALVSQLYSNETINGLSEFLTGNAHMEDVLLETDVPNLHVIVAGMIPPNPTALLQNRFFEVLLERCRQQYDIIIVDTPPLGLVTDAMVIGKQMDSSVLVVESEAVSRQDVIRMKESLERTSSQFLGVILNKMDQKVSSYGDYGAYGAYGKKRTKNTGK